MSVISEPVHDEWKPGQTILNDYRIIRLLGRGGMGAVFLVERKSSGSHLFAVKTLLSSTGMNHEQKRLFLREIQYWINLPKHPHIITCHFVRSVNRQLAVFSEYAAGGSLSDWIESKRLTRLEKILDVAIQIAWGLHFAHEQGLIHQDVKSSNVLLTPEGIAKLSDFGLARLSQPCSFNGLDFSSSVRSHSSGLTFAFSSPEQANNEPVTIQSDIWSYGLILLEMFSGGAHWQFGFMAPQILENYVRKSTEPSFLHMPESLRDILDLCFKRNPSSRWQNMRSIIEKLTDAYFRELGHEYPRKKPEAHCQSIDGDVHSDLGKTWMDPIPWLVKSGDPSRIRQPSERLHSNNGLKSFRAKAFQDLELFEAAAVRFERKTIDGDEPAEIDLANVLFNMAQIHFRLHNLHGTLSVLDDCLPLLQKWSRNPHREDLIKLLIDSLRLKAKVQEFLVELRGAEETIQQALELNGALMQVNHDVHLQKINIELQIQLGVNLYQQGRYRKSKSILEQNRRLVLELMESIPDSEISLISAKLDSCTANVLSMTGDLAGARDLYLKSLSEYEKCADSVVFPDSNREIAFIYMNLSFLFYSEKVMDRACDYCSQAIKMRERLVAAGCSPDSRIDLVRSYTLMGNILEAQGKTQDALAVLERSGLLCEQVVYMEGRSEFEPDLLKAYALQISILIRRNDVGMALQKTEKMIFLSVKRKNQLNDMDSIHQLMTTFLIKTDLLLNGRELKEASRCFDECLALLDQYHTLVPHHNSQDYVRFQTELVEFRKSSGCVSDTNAVSGLRNIANHLRHYLRQSMRTNFHARINSIKPQVSN